MQMDQVWKPWIYPSWKTYGNSAGPNCLVVGFLVYAFSLVGETMDLPLLYHLHLQACSCMHICVGARGDVVRECFECFSMALTFWSLTSMSAHYMLQVKKLEELGIGRPSTYASTLKVLQVNNGAKMMNLHIYSLDRWYLKFNLNAYWIVEGKSVAAM